MSANYARNSTVTLYGIFKRESEKAVLFSVSSVGIKNQHKIDPPQDEWFPLSTVWEMHKDEIEGQIVVEEWIARKKGLI